MAARSKSKSQKKSSPVNRSTTPRPTPTHTFIFGFIMFLVAGASLAYLFMLLLPGSGPSLMNSSAYRCPTQKNLNCVSKTGVLQPECDPSYSSWIKNNCAAVEFTTN